jgi:anti-sigma-K factor RskA
MTEEHDALRPLLGGYVLGGLDPAERARLEAHLEYCADCREELARYAPLPALLQRAGPPPEPADPEESMWSGLAAAARAERAPRRGRGKWMAAAAAAVLLVATAVGVLVADPFAQPGVPFVAVAGAGSSGHGELEARPWGTAVSLRLAGLAGLAGDDRFVAWVVSTEGTREQAATWGATPNGAAEVSGASSIPSEQIALVRVTTGGGRPLLEMHPNADRPR